MNLASLYKSDFHARPQYHADALRTQNIAKLDLANLIDEIETGIERIHFPQSCPWQPDQCMSDDSWPQTEQKQDHS